jgi:hypothetical protein
MNALTVGFPRNEFASGRLIGIEGIEGFQKVSSVQSAKDSLKGMADGDHTVTVT